MTLYCERQAPAPPRMVTTREADAPALRRIMCTVQRAQRAPAMLRESITALALLVLVVDG